ncbi:MAG TPA: acetamidase/formamidase family protein [Coriobacteriia bacterium]
MPYRLPSTASIYAFSPDNPPALTVPDGAVVDIDTCDCFDDQLRTEADTLETLDWEKINPATGPIYIEGVRAGGVLKVTIESIDVGEQGVIATGKGLGVLGDRFEGMTRRYIPFVDGAAVWDDKLSLPLRPMIGVIGVAPASGSVGCGTPGPHGGNMDNKMITAGTTLYLPVFADGGLFACGDLHAVMGDGEVCVAGAETPGTVRVRFDFLPALTLANPVLETDDGFYTIGSAETLDAAVTLAVGDMADLLVARLGMALDDVVMLMSLSGNAQICQVVDPLRTARYGMSKSVLAAYGFEL